MYRIVIFDIDGTLRDEAYGVPPSAIKAVEELKSKGILVCLCTGRTRETIPEDVRLLSEGCVIAGGGSYVEYRGEVLWNRYFKEKDINEVYGYLKELPMTAAVLEGRKKIYMNQSAAARMSRDMENKWKHLTEQQRQQMRERQKITYLDNFTEFEKSRDCISKVCIWPIGNEMENLRQYSFWNSCQAAQKAEPPEDIYYELILKGCHKGDAVSYLCGRLGIQKQEVLAFGDGMNDAELFLAAGAGVAMENSAKELFPYADSVCEPPMKDGIYKELIKRGII